MILELAQKHVKLKRVASTGGGEWAGPCPKCGGTDRLRVWDKKNQFWCRQCGAKGDSIEFLKWTKGLSYADACRELNVPMKPKRVLRSINQDWWRFSPARTELNPEPIQTQEPAQICAPIEETPPVLKLVNPACMTCKSNYKNWCTVHPRNQFVNIEFIERCPKELGD